MSVGEDTRHSAAWHSTRYTSLREGRKKRVRVEREKNEKHDGKIFDKCGRKREKEGGNRRRTRGEEEEKGGMRGRRDRQRETGREEDYRLTCGPTGSSCYSSSSAGETSWKWGEEAPMRLG